MFRGVLVGVDGRQGGRDAIGLARQLASSDGGLTLAHVCTPFLGRGAVESVPSQRAEAQRLLERERDRAAVDADLAVGDPLPVGPGLHGLAEQRRSDLLVVGSTRPVGRLVHGSVSGYLVGHATCPLLVLPRGTLAVAPPPDAERQEHAAAVRDSTISPQGAVR